MEPPTVTTEKATSSTGTRVTESEFQKFCEEGQDPLLQHLEREQQTLRSAPGTSLRYPTLPRYTNTYRTEPTRKFFPGKVGEIIRRVLSESLENVTYKPVRCAQYACELSERIKELVKRLDIPRYKIVSFVSIGELSGQGVRVASRCAWNPKFDNYASASFKNRSLFAVGIVYALYLE